MEFNLIAPHGCGAAYKDKTCLPDRKTLERLLNGGFKFYVDGKRVAKAEALKFAPARKREVAE